MILLRRITFPRRALKLNKSCPGFIQAANITGRATRGGPLKLPRPFPYQEKKVRIYHHFLDNTLLRLCEENAKIIVVEGPIAAGKTAFAKALAEELDMLFLDQPTMDDLLILPSGYDLRQHDNELSKFAQSFDHKDFCKNPTDTRNGFLTYKILCLKLFKYIDALAHLFNTGQGVVLERSYFSDFAFTDAMVEQKFMSKDLANLYHNVKRNTGSLLLPPHLVIYLDMPVPVVQERIRTRNYSYEQNSPALTKGYLESLERIWKQNFLQFISKYSEILVYDWSDGGDIEVVVDDIENIDFHIDRADDKFKYWQRKRGFLFKLRQMYTNHKPRFRSYLWYPWYKAPEYADIESSVFQELDLILEKIPECRYDKGYNYLMGDSILKMLFKSKTENYRDSKFHLAWNYGLAR